MRCNRGRTGPHQQPNSFFSICASWWRWPPSFIFSCFVYIRYRIFTGTFANSAPPGLSNIECLYERARKKSYATYVHNTYNALLLCIWLYSIFCCWVQRFANTQTHTRTHGLYLYCAHIYYKYIPILGFYALYCVTNKNRFTLYSYSIYGRIYIPHTDCIII